MKNKILKLLVKHVNIKGFCIEMMTEVVDECLEKIVKDSANPFDNVAKAALYPELEKMVIKYVEDKLDLNKILKLEDK